MNRNKSLLLINGFASPTAILNEFLSDKTSDSNIYLSYPLGVLTLAGWCRQEIPNIKIQILDIMLDLHKYISNKPIQPLSINDFILKELNQIDFIPDFVGISINFSNGYKPCLQLCRQCKQKWPNCKIVAGGVHATSFSRQIIDSPFIDYVIRGAGDMVFPKTIQCLIDEQTPDHIQGVVTGPSNLSSMAPPLDDLDLIPPYPYDLIDMEYLILNESTSPVFEKDMRTGIIFMSRGCPFNCTFCAAHKVHGKKTHFKSVNRIVREIEHLINHFHVNKINIMDDLFGADKTYFYNFFKKIEERGLNFTLDIPAGLSIKIFDEEMIDVLIKYGLRAIYFPLESGSKFVQEHIIKKRIDLDKAIRLINHTKRKGLFTGINIVLGSPGETKEMIYETYEFIKKLPVDWIAFFAAYPYPGTEMTDILLKNSLITEDDLMNIWDNSTQGFKQRPFDTKEISGEELTDLVYDFNIQLNFFFNYNIRTKNFINILPKLYKIIKRYPFHIIALACRAKCYHGIGRDNDSQKDIAKIIDLIKTNSESKKLFKKYKLQIKDTLNFSNKFI